MSTPITAALVMQLRERTGAGMMECKKFLIAADGDIEKAVSEMRIAGQAKADKKSGRIAAQGRVVIERSVDRRTAIILEINSETDFVARDQNFLGFTNETAKIALATLADSVEELSSEAFNAEHTVEQARQELVSKIGENIKLRRIAKLSAPGVVGSYSHDGRIGVLVALKQDDDELAKDIAMHIAASRPIVVSPEQIPAEAIQNEREIFTAQAHESGKPAEVIEKMIEGRISKFMEEVCLLGQPFVKNPDRKVGQLVKEKNNEVLAFIRYEVGEGIEKVESNFAEEVKSQVLGS